MIKKLADLTKRHGCVDCYYRSDTCNHPKYNNINNDFTYKSIGCLVNGKHYIFITSLKDLLNKL
jgi:hypothetical protein